MNAPGVCVAVIIERDGKILLGRRKTGARYYGLPGGHLEMGESLHQAAQREVEEETGIHVCGTKFLSIGEDFRLNEDKHYLVVFMLAELYDAPADGEGLDWVPEAVEPELCEYWGWYGPENLPHPLFPLLHEMLHDIDWDRLLEVA